MSILTATADDFAGRQLPNGTYRVTVLEAKVETTETDSNGAPTKQRLTRMYGNIRRATDGAVEFTPDGGAVPFRIGNRKLFARSWILHPNEQAQSIGQREIKREAVSAGLLEQPKKGESIDINIDEGYASTLMGRDVVVRTQIKPRDKALPDGEKNAEIVAWVKA
jgi:hypothetical protein